MKLTAPVCSTFDVMIFLTLLRESISFAFHALRVNRLRTLLSLLGITIGIFAIIAVFTAVDSMEYKVRSSVQSLGENVIYIEKWPWAPEDGVEYEWWEYMNRPVAQVSEAEELARRLTLSEAVVFTARLRKTVNYKTSFVENAQVQAAMYPYDRVKTFNISTGRYFTEQETEAGKSVCIIGDNIRKALFNLEDPLGTDIKVFGLKVTVVGVFDPEGESLLGNSMDSQILMPLEFIRNIADVRKEELSPNIMVKALPGVAVADLKDEVKGIMRSIRRLKPTEDENFTLNEVSILSSGLEQMFGIIGTAGWIIGAFSILVGGFGIANIMFVSVRERTGQIGIQKALGAKNWFILTQFLTESIVLCIIGGVLGLVLVWGGTAIASSALDFDFTLKASNIVLGLTISVLIGIISGFIPSYSASQLDPVEAIRSSS